MYMYIVPIDLSGTCESLTDLNQQNISLIVRSIGLHKIPTIHKGQFHITDVTCNFRGQIFGNKTFFLHTSLNKQFFIKICTNIHHMMLNYQRKRNFDFILKS